MLLDHFHLTPEQIGSLTDRQIVDLYFHKRDSHNNIVRDGQVVFRANDSFESTMDGIFKLSALGLVSPERIEELKEEAKKKWGWVAPVPAQEEPPEKHEAESLEEQLEGIEKLGALFPPETLAQLREEAKQKWAKKEA